MHIRPILLGMAAAACLAMPALAHHSFAMFDNKKQVTWTGTVVQFRWANPHTHILVEVPSTKGGPAAGRWMIEGGSPNIMSRQGWRKTSYKVGDPITIVGYPMRNGSKAGSLYYAVKDGKRLYHDVNRSGGPAGGAG